MPSLIGRCGGGACGGLIDSTAHAGATCGVHSVGVPAGEVLQADGAGGSLWAAGGGGYTPPTSIEQISTAYTNASPGVLSLSHNSGASLFNFGTPTHPKPSAAGIYALSLYVDITAGSIAVGDFIAMTLAANLAGAPVTNSPQASAWISRTSTGFTLAPQSAHLTVYLALTSTIEVDFSAVAGVYGGTVNIWAQRIT